MTATAQPGQRGAPPGAPSDRESWSEEVDRLDLAVYLAIAETPTPRLDRVFRRLSRAADRSKLWIATATVLAPSAAHAAAKPRSTAWPRSPSPRRSST